MNKTEVLVRVYVCDAFGLMSMDEEGNSDPYIKIKLGKNVIDDVETVFENDCDPEFMKKYELNTTLPGASLLKVQVWDHDEVFEDEMIG